MSAYGFLQGKGPLTQRQIDAFRQHFKRQGLKETSSDPKEWTIENELYQLTGVGFDPEGAPLINERAGHAATHNWQAFELMCMGYKKPVKENIQLLKRVKDPKTGGEFIVYHSTHESQDSLGNKIEASNIYGIEEIPVWRKELTRYGKVLETDEITDIQIEYTIPWNPKTIEELKPKFVQGKERGNTTFLIQNHADNRKYNVTEEQFCTMERDQLLYLATQSWRNAQPTPDQLLKQMETIVRDMKATQKKEGRQPANKTAGTL